MFHFILVIITGNDLSETYSGLMFSIAHQNQQVCVQFGKSSDANQLSQTQHRNDVYFIYFGHFIVHFNCECDCTGPSYLRTHFTRHSGEKPTECNQCAFVSCHPSALRKHVWTHSGEKSNICNQCNFTTSKATNLKRHLKAHSGENQHITNVGQWNQ